MNTPDSPLQASRDADPVSREAGCCNGFWRSKWCALSMVALALIVGLLFLQPPGFGDDLTYWIFAFNLHRIGLKAWHLHSFHDLRWPVWGVCWILQKLFHFGYASYIGEPLLYLAVGALLTFFLGRKLTGSPAVAWACGVAFLFHPLLDTVAYRPMPDLSEGVWGAAVILAWWAMMHAQTRSRALLFALLTGAGVYIAESNRVTGVFIVPVLLLCTLLEFRRRFHWLVAAGCVAALLYGAECFFYHQLFGDWFHNIHANLGNKGAKGTGSIALWRLPIRFLPALAEGSLLAPFYFLFALLGSGIVLGLRLSRFRIFAGETTPQFQPSEDARILGRVVFFWFILLYLAYSCAPQGFKGGWNPLIRDADRFLCGLVVPMSLLAVIGLATLFHHAQRWRPVAWSARRPFMLAALALLLLVAGTERSRFDRGFIPKMQRYMAALPAGTKIFTHDSMRGIAFLVDPAKAGQFVWHAPNAILNYDPRLETTAAECDELWYVRKLVWLTTRKKLQKSGIAQQQTLASYFEEPDRDWVTANLLAKGDTPDLIFLRRRTPADPLPRILPSTAPEFAGLIPPLPLQWNAKGQPAKRMEPLHWEVPAALRGQFIRIELHAASPQVEALAVSLRFFKDRQLRAEYLLKPYFHPEPGKEFFAFEIPADATRCDIQPRLSKNAKTISLLELRAVITAPPKEGR